MEGQPKHNYSATADLPRLVMLLGRSIHTIQAHLTLVLRVQVERAPCIEHRQVWQGHTNQLAPRKAKHACCNAAIYSTSDSCAHSEQTPHARQKTASCATQHLHNAYQASPSNCCAEACTQHPMGWDFPATAGKCKLKTGCTSEVQTWQEGVHYN